MPWWHSCGLFQIGASRESSRARQHSWFHAASRWTGVWSASVAAHQRGGLAPLRARSDCTAQYFGGRFSRVPFGEIRQKLPRTPFRDRAETQWPGGYQLVAMGPSVLKEEFWA